MDFSLHLRYGDANGKEGGSSWRGGEVRNPTKHIALILQINYNWGMSRAFFTTLSALTLVGGTHVSTQELQPYSYGESWSRGTRSRSTGWQSSASWSSWERGFTAPSGRSASSSITSAHSRATSRCARSARCSCGTAVPLLLSRQRGEEIGSDRGPRPQGSEYHTYLHLYAAAQFESSCNYYIQNDIEIRLLLDHFRKDLDLALEGVIETYNGPLPRFPA